MRICYIFSRFLIKIILKFVFFIRFDVNGKEFIPKKGAFLLIANHLSYLDPLAIGINCPRILTFIAGRDLFDNRILGGWMKSVGVIDVKRDRADIKSIRGSLDLLEKGKALAMFPEGRRIENPESSFHELKKGFLFLSKKSGAPIVAAKITGSEKAMPKNSNRIKFGAQINVAFSKPFFIEPDEDYDQAMKRLEAVLASL